MKPNTLQIFSTVPRVEEMFDRFHQELTKYYEDNNAPLYDPDAMRKFAESCTPGLFDRFLKMISAGHKSSTKRSQLQLQRTVSILHTLSYFRNQVLQHNLPIRSFMPM